MASSLTRGREEGKGGEAASPPRRRSLGAAAGRAEWDAPHLACRHQPGQARDRGMRREVGSEGGLGRRVREIAHDHDGQPRIAGEILALVDTHQRALGYDVAFDRLEQGRLSRFGFQLD